jgi:hypothetical protein
MADAAYTIFFAAIFVGGSSFLHLFAVKEWPRVAAALRGERFDEVPVAPNRGQISIVERPQPILKPATISICRI